MPSKEAHLAAAEQCQKTTDFLRADLPQFADWVAIAAFYKAVHLVEAMFACEMGGGYHVGEHKDRNQRLKKMQRYSHIWKHYRELWQASLIARYISDINGNTRFFTSYMTPERVQSILLDHHLRQVEQSCAKFIR